MFGFLVKRLNFSKFKFPSQSIHRGIWLWNKAPNGVAKIEKLSLSYYCYNPKYLISKEVNPIVCLHGLYTSKEFFYGIAPVLAQKLARPIYVLDLRNHGESPHRNFDGKATLMIMVQDVLNFMDEFSIKKSLIIGHGMGGRVSIQFTQLNESRVEKVITIDISQDGPHIYSKTFPKYLRYLEEFDLTQKNSSLSYVRLVMKEMLKTQVKNPFFLKYILNNIAVSSNDTFKWKFNASVLEQILKNWSQVKHINYSQQFKGPILNIVSKNNYITSEDYLDIKRAFQDCQVEYYNSRFVTNNKPVLIKTIENFSYK